MTSRGEDTLFEEFQNIPKQQLSESAKQRMLSEIQSQRTSSKSRSRFPRWVGSATAGIVGIAVVVAGYVAISNQHRTLPQRPSHTVATKNQSDNALKAETTRMQKVTDSLGKNGAVLHRILTHTVAALDAYHFGSSEIQTPGAYDFQSGSVEQYLQNDYSKFEAAFGTELTQIDNHQPPKGSTSKYVTLTGNVLTFHDDWAILDAINTDYQQLIAFYNPITYEKFSEKMGNQDQQLGNKSTGTVEMNDLRQWNEVLFGGQLQVDVPKF